MDFTLGIVGPNDTVEQVLTVGKKHFHNIKFVSIIYKQHKQIVNLIQQYLNNVNGLLFTGITPYKIANSEIDFSIPVEYIPREVIILYKILFEIMHDQKIDKIENLSIDTFNEEEIKEFLDELTFPVKNFYVFENSSQTDEVVNFHEQLYNSKKVDICLTTALDPYLELQKKGIPIKRILPTNFSIKKSLEFLLLKTKSDRSRSAQISVGIINIDNFKKIIKERPSEYQIQKIKLKLHELILDYCEETQSTLVYNGSDEFIIFTTVGSLRNLGKNFNGSLVETIRSKLPLTVSYGLGLGYTANDAMHNAHIALEHAKLNGGNCAFLRHFDRTMVGPLETINNKKIAIDPKVVHKLSQEINIVPPTLTKILNAILSLEKTTFDAKEFSQHYGCTLRTSHRILSTLTSSNIIEILAYDQTYNKGRPRRLYKLNTDKLFN